MLFYVTKIQILQYFYQTVSANCDNFEPEKINISKSDDYIAIKKDFVITLYNLNELSGRVIRDFNPNENIKLIGDKEVRVLIPGYNCYNITLDFIKDEYLKKLNLNVFTIKWIRELIPTPEYLYHVKNRIFNFISNLMITNNIKQNKVVLVGLGIGAHIAGDVGRSLAPLKFRAIIGLDPDWLFFEDSSNNKRISSNDAEYVEIIHTSEGLRGFEERLGYSDFFLNYQYQYGCLNGEHYLECSYKLAALVFGESINSNIGFWGVKCQPAINCKEKETYIIGGVRKKMGGEPPNGLDVVGEFRLTTNLIAPYARGRNISFSQLEPDFNPKGSPFDKK